MKVAVVELYAAMTVYVKPRRSIFLDPSRLFSQLMALCQPMSAHSINAITEALVIAAFF